MKGDDGERRAEGTLRKGKRGLEEPWEEPLPTVGEKTVGAHPPCPVRMLQIKASNRFWIYFRTGRKFVEISMRHVTNSCVKSEYWNRAAKEASIRVREIEVRLSESECERELRAKLTILIKVRVRVKVRMGKRARIVGSDSLS